VIEKTKQGNKGYALEEVLRAYFLRAGFFVVRGIPYSIDQEDITDIDLWLYEKSTSTVRRRQIIDIKSKNKPRAMERIIWTKGLVEILKMDGAYVATTDNRAVSRKIANKLGIKLLDGQEIKRIQERKNLLFEERITDEQLFEHVRQLDKQRRNKEVQSSLNDLKTSALIGLGPNSLVRSLEAFEYFVRKCVEAHPNSDSARLFGRLTYLSAAFIAFNLDFIGAEASFRSNEEKRNIFMNAIRYGNQNKVEALRDVRVATELIRKYTDNGNALASSIEDKISKDLEKIPAEIIADQMIRSGKEDAVFNYSRSLEQFAYHTAFPNFDGLETEVKSFMGALLDYCSIDRTTFASCWTMKGVEEKTEGLNAGPLFNYKS